MISNINAFDSLIAAADSAGYDLAVEWFDGVVPTLTLTKKDTLLPDIDCETEMVEQDGFPVYYFKVNLKFPEVSCPSSELEYDDSIESLVRTWKEVSRFCTRILKFEYDERKYEE